MTLPFDLYDEDECAWAVSALNTTRGQARAMLTREQDVPFTTGRVRLIHLRRDPDFENTVILCGPSSSGAQPYWAWSP